MSGLDIVIWPDARLTQLGTPVDIITPESVQLLADMFDTMYDAPGRGLAAPQVGRSERIFVFDAGWKDGAPTPIACVNPEIIALSDDRLTGEEGCLSIPGVPMDIARAAQGHSTGMKRYMDDALAHQEIEDACRAPICVHATRSMSRSNWMSAPRSDRASGSTSRRKVFSSYLRPSVSSSSGGVNAWPT